MCRESMSIEKFPITRKTKSGFGSICISCIQKKKIKIRECKKQKLCRKCKRILDLTLFDTDNRALDGKTPFCTECRQNDRTLVKDRKRLYDRIRMRYRRREIVEVRLLDNLRNRLYCGLKNNTKNKRTLQLIGCSIEELKQHLEKKFQEGMTWSNYGRKGWHIDHIIPISSFDLSNIEEQNMCFHYTNLQPLWQFDNLSKGCKIL